MPLQYVNKAGVSFTLDGFYDDTNRSTQDRFLWGGKIEIRKGGQSLVFEDLNATAEYKTPQTDTNTSVPY